MDVTLCGRASLIWCSCWLAKYPLLRTTLVANYQRLSFLLTSNRSTPLVTVEGYSRLLCQQDYKRHLIRKWILLQHNTQSCPLARKSSVDGIFDNIFQSDSDRTVCGQFSFRSISSLLLKIAFISSQVSLFRCTSFLAASSLDLRIMDTDASG